MITAINFLIFIPIFSTFLFGIFEILMPVSSDKPEYKFFFTWCIVFLGIDILLNILLKG